MHHLGDSQVVFLEAKSQKGRRKVALSPAAVSALREHRERQELERLMTGTQVRPDDPVVSHRDGSPFLPNSVTHAFIKIARSAGLEGIRFYDLRHTHASLMLRQGIHPKIVSERLGHATVSITLDTYSHVTPGLQEAAALSFEEGLTAARAKLSYGLVRGAHWQSISRAKMSRLWGGRETAFSASISGTPGGIRTPDPRFRSGEKGYLIGVAGGRQGGF
jgi:hypothetical protein